MNVHIVCSRINADRVLPRLARALSKQTGWTIAEAPNPNAALNYFFPYIELQKREWTQTKSAAWFTHRDTINKQKQNLFDNVAARVDLRTLTASIYKKHLSPHGAVNMVRPAVEQDRFVPVSRKRGRRIGLSGWLYGDNRKGEDLIAKLVQSESGKQCEWAASGRGWSVPTMAYKWKQMPAFYQSLDLFVCASRIEGVPMPPLEVLSCGIPVIIPRGVGMLDDLPDIQGIYRFESGNYDDLKRVFDIAINDKPADPEALREAVSPYSLKNWTNDHRIAFERLLYGTGPINAKSLPQWKGRAGVYCVAFGDPSRECAIRLIGSVKKYMPGLPVMLVSDKPLNVGEDHFIKQDDRDVGGRWAKLAVDKLAPKEWDYIIYLDADTELIRPIDFIFNVLQDGWEFIICKDMAERHFLAQMNRGDNDDECRYTEKLVGTDRVMQYNGGVFAYRRNDSTRAFFDGWNTEYDKWCRRDQGALIRSFYLNKMRVFVLMNQWNASDRYELPPGDIAIMHHNVQARRYGKGILGRLDGKNAWQMVKQYESQKVKEKL